MEHWEILFRTIFLYLLILITFRLTGTVLVTLLHFATVLKRISFSFYIMDYLKIFLAIGVSGYTGYTIYNGLPLDTSMLYKVVVSTVSMAAIYSLLVLFLKLIRPEELKRIPKVGHFLSKLSPR